MVGIEFQVEERESFALPHDPEAADKPYTFKEVKEDGTIVIEYEEDGETKTKELASPN